MQPIRARRHPLRVQSKPSSAPIIVVIAVVLLGGGVAAFFGFQPHALPASVGVPDSVGAEADEYVADYKATARKIRAGVARDRVVAKIIQAEDDHYFPRGKDWDRDPDTGELKPKFPDTFAEFPADVRAKYQATYDSEFNTTFLRDGEQKSIKAADNARQRLIEYIAANQTLPRKERARVVWSILKEEEKKLGGSS